MLIHVHCIDHPVVDWIGARVECATSRTVGSHELPPSDDADVTHKYRVSAPSQLAVTLVVFLLNGYLACGSASVEFAWWRNFILFSLVYVHVHVIHF